MRLRTNSGRAIKALLYSESGSQTIASFDSIAKSSASFLELSIALEFMMILRASSKSSFSASSLFIRTDNFLFSSRAYKTGAVDNH